MFTLTREWLLQYYGSKNQGQVEETKNWLLKYGHNVFPSEIDEWAKFKHLSEYQVNTNNIVPLCLRLIDTHFINELHAHSAVNSLRVPGASKRYKECLCAINPSTILELGTGGDSAISTSHWLSWVKNKQNKEVISVDRNPLGVTKERYEKYPFWSFIQNDSLVVLSDYIKLGKRFDMVFIDTIHSFNHTLAELMCAEQLTDNIVCDDSTFEGNDFDPSPGGVKKAIEQWFNNNSNKWVIEDSQAVAMIRRK